MSYLDGLEKVFAAMAWLALVGAVALLYGTCWGLWWMFNHVVITVTP